MAGGLPKSGTLTGIGTSAVALAASEYCQSIGIQADPANAVNLLLGDSAAQDMVLTPGSSISLDVRDPSDVFVKAVSGTLVANFVMVI